LNLKGEMMKTIGLKKVGRTKINNEFGGSGGKI